MLSFQFKHCTIIRIKKLLKEGRPWKISIQALYDYKIRAQIVVRHPLTPISIQALYDYKLSVMPVNWPTVSFQFKHCTIISTTDRTVSAIAERFQFKHCTIISNWMSQHLCVVLQISIQALYDYKPGGLRTTRVRS